MSNLPTAAALALLVLVAGIGGVVAADPTDVSPTATPVAVETDAAASPAAAPAATHVTVPPDDDGFAERLAHRLSQFDLTDGQIRVIVQDAVRLREAGASRLVVKSSIVMHLYQFGVDAPFLYAGDGDEATAGERFAARLGERFDLTDDQVAELAATIDRMHADGATRLEIYRAVRALLAEYGVGEDALAALDRDVKHAYAHRLHERADALDDRAHRLHHEASHDGPRNADWRVDADRQADADRRTATPSGG